MSTFIRYQDPFPAGAIIPWHAAADEVPAGWAVCDGNNGTPDLTNRYLRGVPDGTTDPGTIGGSNAYNLSTSQLPGHTHGGNTANAGSHRHNYKVNDDAGNQEMDIANVNVTKQRREDNDLNNTSPRTTAGGDHTHNIALGNTGGNSSVDNQPAYTTTLFIQKL